MRPHEIADPNRLGRHASACVYNEREADLLSVVSASLALFVQRRPTANLYNAQMSPVRSTRSAASSSSSHGKTSVPNSPAAFSHSLSPAPSMSSSASSPLSSPPSSYAGSRPGSPAYTPAPLPNKTDNEREAWTALQSAETGDVLRSVLRVRKTWKTARGGETVWPLDLEAALLEARSLLDAIRAGLEQYVPDDSRETRMLGRFPRRNRFISEYILAKTGKHRTPKQVGSRLQQLRESCGGQKLLHLLSPFREPPSSPGSSADSSSSSALGSPTPSAGSFLDQAAAPHTTMYIDILPTSRSPVLQSAHIPSESPVPSQRVLQASPTPRHIGQINPLSTFTSPAPLSAHARFTVLSESAGLVLHAETVPLELLADAPESGDVFANGLYYYSARIVPRYWPVIVESPDPTRFTIFQEIVQDDSAASVVFTATYRFRYPTPSPSSHQCSPLHLSGALPDLDMPMGMPVGLDGESLALGGFMESDYRTVPVSGHGGWHGLQ
ncbi:TEA domain-containing protein [Mycena chlorophos]|uniref:TEA domain-containing protein n=1 Tax=Mycena chlorophos TaxID=658473 RepID=A0A8H6SU83_MYCCL|nr:TEA domain-containing protein [Mycena chlorophos]